MPIFPSTIDPNTWDICITTIVDGQLKVHREVFVGSIREAVLFEMQLRELAKDDRSGLNQKRAVNNGLD